jgi:hypothetical protein
VALLESCGHRRLPRPTARSTPRDARGRERGPHRSHAAAGRRADDRRDDRRAVRSKDGGSAVGRAGDRERRVLRVRRHLDRGRPGVRRRGSAGAGGGRGHQRGDGAALLGRSRAGGGCAFVAGGRCLGTVSSCRRRVGCDPCRP